MGSILKKIKQLKKTLPWIVGSVIFFCLAGFFAVAIHLYTAISSVGFYKQGLMILLLLSVVFLLFLIVLLVWLYRTSKKNIIVEPYPLERRREMKLAYTDELTNLSNRSFFSEVLKKTIAHAKRSNQRVALLYLDLDNFKRVNDTYGHDQGDLLLQLAGKRIEAASREEDTVARVGGDEFALLLQDIQAPQEAAEVAERIVYYFKQPFILNGIEIYSSPSIGIALYPDIGKDSTELMHFADLAMYNAKEKGRNQYKFFTQKFNEALQRKNLVESRLKEALKNDECRLAYQLQYDFNSKRVVGMECLVRWKNEELGYVSPGEFIPIAEDSGLITEIGHWILESAFQQFKAWLAAEPELMKDIHVGVNVSAVQLEKINMAQLILMALSDAALPAENVMIEITETAMMKNHRAATRTMDELERNQVPVSLDDFGTGYSSINLLRHPAVKQIKVDTCFTKDLLVKADSEKIISGLVQLSKELDLSIVAEGIESAMQINRLEKTGCYYVQGYHFCKPLEADQVIAQIHALNRL